MAKMAPSRIKQYVWMKWYLGGTISVLILIEKLWGINTRIVRGEIKYISTKLTTRYMTIRGRKWP